MSDYFERIEEQLREAARRGAHLPWYWRIRRRVSRPAAAATLVVGLVAAGSALAASGVFRTGQPIGQNVPGSPNAYDGVALGSSVHLLGLQVSDPGGGPPWGLRTLRTSRGLKCVQVGRLVDGRIGVLGEDGAFKNDGLFHPLSTDFVQNGACGTADAHGEAFLNIARNGGPANGLLNGESGRAAKGGCYERAAGCPARDLRDIYYGLLGPDAVSVTYTTPSGALTTTPTAGADGAYLIVAPFQSPPCPKEVRDCPAQGGGASIEGPELRAPLPGDGTGQIIRAVTYRDGHTCDLPTAEQVAKLPSAHRIARILHMGCPPVGYVAPSIPHYTHAELASAVSAHVVVAKHYCGKGAAGALLRPCDHGVPPGYRRINLSPPNGEPRHEALVVIEFRSRVPITSDDEHYEVRMTRPDDPGNEECSGGGTFGPIETNLSASQLVRNTELVNADCPGRSQIRVSFTAENGPGGGMPGPGLPGQEPEVPVGETEVEVP